jgi:hypothetical protein
MLTIFLYDRCSFAENNYTLWLPRYQFPDSLGKNVFILPTVAIIPQSLRHCKLQELAEFLCHFLYNGKMK